MSLIINGYPKQSALFTTIINDSLISSLVASEKPNKKFPIDTKIIIFHN